MTSYGDIDLGQYWFKMGWLPDGIKPLTDPMSTLLWRRQMETFSALLALCVGNFPVTGEFLAPRSVTRNFDVLFDLRLKKRLSKQSKMCAKLIELGTTHYKRSDSQMRVPLCQFYSRHCFQVPPHIEQVLFTPWSDDLIVVWVILRPGSLDNVCVL